jgi:O-antigen ligase
MTPAVPGRWSAERALCALLPLATWAAYAPLGLKYTTWLLAVVLAAASLQQQRRWQAAWQQPGSTLLLGFLALMALSALWSPSAWPRIGRHFWIYSLPLGAALLACACPPAAARRALQHFVVASGCVGGLSVLQGWGALPSWALWGSTVTATGNQRIATSVLLALGAAMAGWMAADSASARTRALWLAAAALAAAGLASQDRRTGMLLLPVLLFVLVWAAPLRRIAQGALAVLVVLAALGVWTASDTVRARFAEGISELSTYTPSDAVATSWGQRARMLDVTAAMVRERPVTGHGLGSWTTLWDERITPGTLMADNSTPHNEYLLVAVQAGLPAALLLLAWLLSMMGVSVRAGSRGAPALMLWLTLALAGLAHAVLRDAKFALPLLLLAGLATALSRSEPAADEQSLVIRDN